MRETKLISTFDAQFLLKEFRTGKGHQDGVTWTGVKIRHMGRLFEQKSVLLVLLLPPPLLLLFLTRGGMSLDIF